MFAQIHPILFMHLQGKKNRVKEKKNRKVAITRARPSRRSFSLSLSCVYLYLLLVLQCISRNNKRARISRYIIGRYKCIFRKINKKRETKREMKTLFIEFFPCSTVYIVAAEPRVHLRRGSSPGYFAHRVDCLLTKYAP